MISFRCMQGASNSDGPAVVFIFNFTQNTYVPPQAGHLYLDFNPIASPSFNFINDTYTPPLGDAVTFNF
jgi:hypothetical protein